VSFLAPLWLLLAAAAVVPVLIHLLRRRIGTRLDFPAVRYIERAEREHSRSVKLRNLLLMLLRVAIVLAVTGAAARPLARWIGGAHAPSAIAVVLDNSLSTSVIVDGRPLFEELRETALAALDAATPGDQLWLVTADARVRSGAADELSSIVRETQPLGGSGDLTLALQRAAAAVMGSPLDAKAVAILTDGQRSAWRADRLDLGAVNLVVWAPGGAAPANRTVVSAEPHPRRWSPRGEVVARISSPDSTGYRVALAGLGSSPTSGSTLARGIASAGGEIRVTASPSERGWVAGVVELEPDELPGDDARYFAVWVGAPPRVTVTPGAGPFLRAAIDALRAASRLVEGPDVVVAAADEVTRLPAFIAAPADPLRLADANRALARLAVPWRLDARRTGAGRVRGERLEGVDANVRHPLVRDGLAPSETLATVAGQPWIVAGEGYVLVASPLVPEATTLPVTASFIPWLGEMVAERLGSGGGDVIRLEPGEATTVNERIVTAPQQAGVYAAESDGAAVVLVVNPDPRESELARLTSREVGARFAAREIRVARSARETVSDLFSISARRSLVEPLMIAALLFLLAEAMLSAPSNRRAA
jgi:hypothetical protein